MSKRPPSLAWLYLAVFVALTAMIVLISALGPVHGCS